MSKQKLSTKKETIRLSVTMFPDMKTRMDRMAKKRNTSLSVLINEAIKSFLDKLK